MSAARCDFSDLPVEQCEHCRSGIERHRDPHRDLDRDGFPFTAAYGGRCEGCDRPIRTGDVIVRVAGGGYAHDREVADE